MTVKNQVQLITYPDLLGGNLKMLHEVLDKYFSDIFKGGIHILPPFPSSGDQWLCALNLFGNRTGVWHLGRYSTHRGKARSLA